MSTCEHPSEQISSVCSLYPCLSWRSGLSGPNDLDHLQISLSPSRHPSPPRSLAPPTFESVQAQSSEGTTQPETTLAESATARQSSSASISSSSRHSSLESDGTSLLRHAVAVMTTVVSETLTAAASESATGSGLERGGSSEPDPGDVSVADPKSSSLSQALALLGGGGQERGRSRSSVAEEAPPAFLCPILQDVMSDPVVIATGQTYDRIPIHKWLTAGHRTCPVTGKLLQQSTFLSLHANVRLTSRIPPPHPRSPSYLDRPPPQLRPSPRYSILGLQTRHTPRGARDPPHLPTCWCGHPLPGVRRVESGGWEARVRRSRQGGACASVGGKLSLTKQDQCESGSGFVQRCNG